MTDLREAGRGMKLMRLIMKLTCTHVCRRPMDALDTEYGCVCGSLQID